jgi:hypothetical protein
MAKVDSVISVPAYGIQNQGLGKLSLYSFILYDLSELLTLELRPDATPVNSSGSDTIRVSS